MGILRPAGCGAESASGSPTPPPPEGGDEPWRAIDVQRSGGEASGPGPPGAKQRRAQDLIGDRATGAGRRRRDHDVSTTRTIAGRDAGSRAALAIRAAFGSLAPGSSVRHDWVVYAKRPVAGRPRSSSTRVCTPPVASLNDGSVSPTPRLGPPSVARLRRRDPQ